MQVPANAHVALADGERFLLMRNTGSAAEPRLELVEEPDLDGDQLQRRRSATRTRRQRRHRTAGRARPCRRGGEWLNRAVLQQRSSS